MNKDDSGFEDTLQPEYDFAQLKISNMGKGRKSFGKQVACRVKPMIFEIEIEQEEDGRWIAEIPALPGVMLYGQTIEEAKIKVQALALRVIAERIENGETQPELVSVAFSAA